MIVESANLCSATWCIVFGIEKNNQGHLANMVIDVDSDVVLIL
jgi:hypothetical protein